MIKQKLIIDQILYKIYINFTNLYIHVLMIFFNIYKYIIILYFYVYNI